MGLLMMSKILYPAIFEVDDGTIVVSFPDVPGAITTGEDMQHAYEMAEEALGTMLEDVEQLPTISTLEEVQERYPKRAIALISVDLLAFKRKHNTKTVKKNTSIPAWLNDLAENEHINFSKTLTEALKHKLNVE